MTIYEPRVESAITGSATLFRQILCGPHALRLCSGQAGGPSIRSDLFSGGTASVPSGPIKEAIMRIAEGDAADLDLTVGFPHTRHW